MESPNDECHSGIFSESSYTVFLGSFNSRAVCFTASFRLIPDSIRSRSLEEASSGSEVGASGRGAPATTSTNSPLGGWVVYRYRAWERVVRTTSSWSLVSSRQRLMLLSGPKVSTMSARVAVSLWGAS